MVRFLFHIINFLFLTGAVYCAVESGYSLLQIRMTTPPEAASADRGPESEAGRPAQPLLFYQPIVARDLFRTQGGVASEDGPAAPEVEIDKLEKTALRLKLRGTVAAAGRNAYAVIESEQENKQDLYRIDDRVESATVKLIFREKVVLSVNGRDEVLEIERQAPGVAPPSGTPPSAETGPAPQPESADARGNPGNRAVQRVTLARSQIDRDITAMDQTLVEIDIAPNPDGLELSNMKPGSFFRKMGLRNGDILAGVDGSPLSSMDDAVRLFEGLRTADTASLTVKRNDRERTIEYIIR